MVTVVGAGFRLRGFVSFHSGDLSLMNSQPRIANRLAWANRLGRFKQADQTVAQFCADEGVSVASFYQWRRKLKANSQNSQTPRRTTAKFLPIQLPASPPASEPETVISFELPGGVRVKVEVRTAGGTSS